MSPFLYINYHLKYIFTSLLLLFCSYLLSIYFSALSPPTSLILASLINSLCISDIYMLHWPDSMQPGRCNRELRAEAWRALEDLYEKGKNTMKYNLITYRLEVDLFTKVGANVCFNCISFHSSFFPPTSLCVPTGLCRTIGVSNFMIHHLKQLKQDCTVVPHINQVSISQNNNRTNVLPLKISPERNMTLVRKTWPCGTQPEHAGCYYKHSIH